ncbi:unnamed protein product [Closterium sp. Naga37s-1]|nr:unnamed protein product [Closterium sp. Naga37s-1]
MPPTTLARLCAVVLALLSVLMTARAQPLAGPRCVNRFPQKPLCKFVDDLAASPLTFLDASAGETIKLGAYDAYQASVTKFHRDLPDTKVYAYGVSRSSARYPGPVLVAKRGTTTKFTQVIYLLQLSSSHVPSSTCFHFLVINLHMPLIYSFLPSFPKSPKLPPHP